MKKSRMKGDKREVRQEMHLTRPPRLEGVVQNRGIKPVRKPKAARPRAKAAYKMQGSSAQSRKAYQLPTRRSK